MDTPTKRCPKCGQTFPRTNEFFHKDKQIADGLACWCKSCKRQDSERRRNEPGYKEYYAEYHKGYYERNADKKCQIASDWQREHPERAKERKHNHYANNKSTYKQKAKSWRIAHPEQAKESQRRRNKRFYRLYPEKARAYAHKRRAAGKVTDETIKAQYKRQKGRCYYCGDKVGKAYHLDHVIPISRNGMSDPDNLVIACPQCNMSKGDRLPHEWGKGGRLL